MNTTQEILLRAHTFSLVMVTASPSWPALPLTLMRSCKNFSNEEGSRTRSSTGMKQSITNLTVCFLEDFLDLGYKQREEVGENANPITEGRRHKEQGGGGGETSQVRGKTHPTTIPLQNQLVIYRSYLAADGVLSSHRVCVAHESWEQLTTVCTYPNAAIRVCDNRREGDSATVSRVWTSRAHVFSFPLILSPHALTPRHHMPRTKRSRREREGQQTKTWCGRGDNSARHTAENGALPKEQHTERHAHSPRAAW